MEGVEWSGECWQKAICCCLPPTNIATAASSTAHPPTHTHSTALHNMDVSHTIRVRHVRPRQRGVDVSPQGRLSLSRQLPDILYGRT